MLSDYIKGRSDTIWTKEENLGESEHEMVRGDTLMEKGTYFEKKNYNTDHFNRMSTRMNKDTH
jgi:hypothetical protein